MKKLYHYIILAGFIIPSVALAQFGNLKDKLKDKKPTEVALPKSSPGTSSESVVSKTALPSGETIYYPMGSNSSMAYIEVIGIGTDKVTYKPYKEVGKAPEAEVVLTKMTDSVYNAIKNTDDDAVVTGLSIEAHNKLFKSSNFDIKDLKLIKSINVSGDWKVVRDEVLKTVLYRTRNVVVIAKQQSTGKCFVMFNSITQEFAGDWQKPRCSYKNEDHKVFFELSDTEALRWGIADEIICSD